MVVELYCYTDSCSYCFVHPVNINEGRLNKRDFSLCNAVQFSATHGSFQQKTEHHNLHEGRRYCMTVVLFLHTFELGVDVRNIK